MKTISKLLLALLLTAPVLTFAQSGPPAPSAGIWAIIDTTYNVGSSLTGTTSAKITLKNTSTSLYTGVQFRVFYDKNAFRNATVSLLLSPANLDFQSKVDSVNGNITITTVYTGTSSAYSMPNGEAYQIIFNHKPAAIFNSLATIDSLKFTGALVFPKYASAQSGLDTTLNVYSYGGVFERPEFKFRGKFKNVTGSGARNITVALEKQPKTGGAWTLHTSVATNTLGAFSFTTSIDTTYFNTRLFVKGDTLGIGNVLSTSDAQLINQWVLGNVTPTAWDFYTGDVNGSNNVTISDAYTVFGKISGRFTSWPASINNVKFFTAAENASVTASPATNFTGIIPGVTNLTYSITAGGPDSIDYHVMVVGDANGTGYRMARITPIELLISGAESQIFNVIDQTVEYDFPTSNIEVGLPKLSVQEGNLVEIPVKVLGGIDLSSLQFGLRYDASLLEFKEIYSSNAAMKWITYVNASNNQIDWGGYDPSNNLYPLVTGQEVVVLRFTALKPQNDWAVSPLWTSNKFAGTTSSKDLEITPANGVIQVMRVSKANLSLSDYAMEVYPNPTEGQISIEFKVAMETEASLGVYDVNGTLKVDILNEKLPEGQYRYSAELGSLTPGIYIATLIIENNKIITKKIIKQN